MDLSGWGHDPEFAKGHVISVTELHLMVENSGKLVIVWTLSRDTKSPKTIKK